MLSGTRDLQTGAICNVRTRAQCRVLLTAFCSVFRLGEQMLLTTFVPHSRSCASDWYADILLGIAYRAHAYQQEDEIPLDYQVRRLISTIKFDISQSNGHSDCLHFFSLVSVQSEESFYYVCGKCRKDIVLFNCTPFCRNLCAFQGSLLHSFWEMSERESGA